MSVEIAIWALSNDVIKDLTREKVTLPYVLEELEASGRKFTTGRYWAGLDYLLGRYPSKSELKNFLTKGGTPVGTIPPAHEPVRAFTADDVKRLHGLLSGIDFEKLKASVTLKELVKTEIYPFKNEENSVRVFLDMKRMFLALKEEIQRLQGEFSGMIVISETMILQ